MKIIGNILWLICGGFIIGLGWAIAGALWCITIIGLPIGKQCFKFAELSLWPFGSDIEYGGGFGSLLLNIIWIIVSGAPLALGSAVCGILCCCTIVGIPFGIQHFKMAKLALMPFGSNVF
ncbi:MAG: YccF domain-containing protein [Ruminococcaceae bacterium]|nr:YccF domain-containing protein [Oscillospiraceae bacterium]